MHTTASHIVEWANTKAKEAQTDLPRVVRRLCFDAGTTRQLSFPAGDSTYVPGWDGVLFSEHGDTWVPVGKSYWEIGCDQDTTGNGFNIRIPTLQLCWKKWRKAMNATANAKMLKPAFGWKAFDE